MSKKAQSPQTSRRFAARCLLGAAALSWLCFSAGHSSPVQLAQHEAHEQAPRFAPGASRATPLAESLPQGTGTPPPPVPSQSVWTRGPYQSIQINIDANGFNIVGDAANEPSIAIDPTDPARIVVGWRQFDTITSDFREAGWAYTHDAGQTWSFAGVLEPGQRGSDPVLAADHLGRFYYYSLQRDADSFLCQLYRSIDGGVSWSPVGPANLGGDKPWMTVDRSNSIGRGYLYLVWSTLGCCGNNIFTRSTDGGETFAPPIAFPPSSTPLSPQWGTLSVGPDGTVHAAGKRPLLDSRFVYSRSTTARDDTLPLEFDFAQEVELGGRFLHNTGTGPNPGGLYGQVWIATDHSDRPTRGNVYILSSVNAFDPETLDPLDVHIIRSTNGGLSWSAPVRINDDPRGNNAWQWFGTMSVAPNGRIDVVWNDTRNDVSATFSEVYYAYSSDGGLTWSDNEPVSLPFAHALGYPQQNKLGDYYHMISDNAGAHLVYAATFNGEQDIYYLRILAEDCNGNGVADSDDIAVGTSEDCNDSGVPDECELAGNDCNVNGVVDACDVSAGTSDDCNGNGRPDECELAGRDCNSNAVPDVCDITSGFSPDCQANAIPDECELVGNDCDGSGVPDECELGGRDCNGNGVLDSCDLSAGTSPDCQANTIPDECELTGNDCNVSGVPDECELAGNDCNANLRLDVCDLSSGFSSDCQDDGIPDECQLTANDCNNNRVPDECELAGKDCNGNQRLDSCDIAVGFSLDCQGNHVPDECELVGNDCNASGVPDGCELAGNDCNVNGRPDECDIAAGTANDCQGDGIPDVCQLFGNDCNGSAVPDDCELAGNDCNGNTWPDDCDIFFGLSNDCQADGTPDECQLAGNDCNLSAVPDECELAGNDCNANARPDECDVNTGNSEDCQFNGTPDECELLGNDCNNSTVPDECELAGNDCNGNSLPDDCELAGKDCNSNGRLDQCDIAAGTSRDCQRNGKPDECELAGNDCNGNTIPDTCELAGRDCNGNQRLDSCDIAQGFSGDCQPDNVPDDCQLAGNDCNGDGIPDVCQLGPNDCNSNALPDDCELEGNDCNGNSKPDVCDLASGSSQDCQENGVPDECELTGRDCDGNGVPDECELASRDCNANGRLDACDIALGISSDCQFNARPDECELIGNDCNRNEVPDDCDLASGESEDDNDNGLLDECEPQPCDADDGLRLVPTSGQESGFYGLSVDISASWSVVGANEEDAKGDRSGAAYIYRLDGLQVLGTHRIVPADGGTDDRFGWAVAAEGDLVAISALYDDDAATNAGAVYVFRFNGSNWVQEAKLRPAVATVGDAFGYDLAISGSKLLIGARYADPAGSNSGAAYVFRYTGSTWVEEARLVALDGQPFDFFGSAVALSGSRAIVGAYGEDDGGGTAGAAYLFHYNGTQWLQQVKLLAPDAAANDWFGSSVAISGDAALISARYNDDQGTDSGAVYPYRFNGSHWVSQGKILPAGGNSNDFFGSDLAIEGNVALVGAEGREEGGANAGTAYVFAFDGISWLQQATFSPSAVSSGAQFGISVAISGTRGVVGAQFGRDGAGRRTGAASYFAGLADCNLNLGLDLCDVESGLSLDANGDIRPDECDLAPPMDFNFDGQVDLLDYAGFVDCSDAPNRMPSPVSNPLIRCLGTFDGDGDLDVDLRDFARLQTALSR